MPRRNLVCAPAAALFIASAASAVDNEPTPAAKALGKGIAACLEIYKNANQERAHLSSTLAAKRIQPLCNPHPPHVASLCRNNSSPKCSF